MNIYIGHRHYWGYGKVPVQTTSGDLEFIPNAVCLDKTCNKHRVWFNGKWWETLEYQWPEQLYVNCMYI